MAGISAIERLFKAVQINDIDQAKRLVKQVESELAFLNKKTCINRPGKGSLILIKEITTLVSHKKIEEAKSKCAKAVDGFNGHVRVYLKPHLEEIGEVQALPAGRTSEVSPDQRKRQRPMDPDSQPMLDKTKTSDPKRPIQNEPGIQKHSQMNLVPSDITRQNENSNSYETSDEANRSSAKETNDFDRIERSKKASFRMKQNNPNIADLSDTNRPTKIAERYSELYDNEWTEAFEELTKKSRRETEIIEYLLDILKEAYKFCTKEAERQVKDIKKVYDRIIEFGPDEFNNPQRVSQSNTHCDEGVSIIVQFRKEIADIALPRLKEIFVDTIVPAQNKKLSLSSHPGAVDKYSEKVIEITWWMCVQDPPLYLCPTDKSEMKGFDKNLYKAYTKSGSDIDFYVWPALKLYKEGGVLAKGVVQFK